MPLVTQPMSLGSMHNMLTATLISDAQKQQQQQQQQQHGPIPENNSFNSLNDGQSSSHTMDSTTSHDKTLTYPQETAGQLAPPLVVATTVAPANSTTTNTNITTTSTTITMSSAQQPSQQQQQQQQLNLNVANLSANLNQISPKDSTNSTSTQILNTNSNIMPIQSSPSNVGTIAGLTSIQSNSTLTTSMSTIASVDHVGVSGGGNQMSSASGTASINDLINNVDDLNIVTEHKSSRYFGVQHLKTNKNLLLFFFFVLCFCF